MRFISFVKQNASQDDPALNSFFNYASGDKEFTASSDPYQLGLYLHDKLTEIQTRGFQMYMMMYRAVEPGNLLPEKMRTDEREFLQAINAIIDLQNNNSGNKPPDTYKATRPMEYVCFYPMEFPTSDKNDIYMFIAVDVFSQEVINTGIELSSGGESMLKQIKLLMENDAFKKHRDIGFTLILHKYQEITDQINKVIHPYGGKFVIDDHYLAIILTPVMEFIFNEMMKDQQKSTL